MLVVHNSQRTRSGVCRMLVVHDSQRTRSGVCRMLVHFTITPLPQKQGRYTTNHVHPFGLSQCQPQSLSFSLFPVSFSVCPCLSRTKKNKEQVGPDYMY